eukprot:scaffold207449_cov16-Tisochrysis_lutea.AAC.1
MRSIPDKTRRGQILVVFILDFVRLEANLRLNVHTPYSTSNTEIATSLGRHATEVYTDLVVQVPSACKCRAARSLLLANANMHNMCPAVILPLPVRAPDHLCWHLCLLNWPCIAACVAARCTFFPSPPSPDACVRLHTAMCCPVGPPQQQV